MLDQSISCMRCASAVGNDHVFEPPCNWSAEGLKYALEISAVEAPRLEVYHGEAEAAYVCMALMITAKPY